MGLAMGTPCVSVLAQVSLPGEFPAWILKKNLSTQVGIAVDCPEFDSQVTHISEHCIDVAGAGEVNSVYWAQPGAISTIGYPACIDVVSGYGWVNIEITEYFSRTIPFLNEPLSSPVITLRKGGIVKNVKKSTNLV